MNFTLIDSLIGKTQEERVLWFLENFGSITNMQCHELLGIRHAPKIIERLRKKFEKEGKHLFITNRPKKGVNRFGEPCNWVEYTLMTKEQYETYKAQNLAQMQDKNETTGQKVA